MSKEKKYYFVAYTKRFRNSEIIFCNDTIMEDPIQWIMTKCKKEHPIILYNLIFYKEITFSQFSIFHPEFEIYGRK